MKTDYMENHRRFITAVCALFLCFATLSALNFSHLGTEDGLAHPAVLDISQDAIGRIWFATEEGVSVFDGNRITSYKAYSDKDSQFLYTGDVVSRICSTSCGGVLLQTDKALVRYDIHDERFKTIVDHPVTGIYSRGDSVWFADRNNLVRWNDRTHEMTVMAQMPFAGARALILDRRNRFFFGTTNGLYTFSDSRFDLMSDIAGFTSLFESSDGTVWAGTKESGLVRVTPDGNVMVYDKSNSSSKGLNINDIRKICEDREGYIWFGTISGLYKYDSRADRFESFYREERSGALSNSSVHSVFVDSNNMLWAGTYYGGVNYVFLGADSYSFYGASDRRNFLSCPVVGEMTEDNDGNIWICTEGGGLNRLNRTDGSITRFSSPNIPYVLPGQNLKSIVFDSENDILYIGTEAAGLHKYDIKTGNFSCLIEGTFNALARENDNLFLSTKTGLVCYSLSTGSKNELFRYSLTGYCAITVDSDKRLWLAHGSDLIVFGAQSQKRLRTYSIADQGITNRITYIFESSDHNFYICTNGRGVFSLNPETGHIVPFTDESSLASNYCYRMAETSDGHLIVSGDKGITVFRKNGEVVKTLSPGGTMPLHSLTRDCGLFVASDGTVYAGGTNGLAAFKEKDLVATEKAPALYFTELHVNGQRIVAGDDHGILKTAIPYTSEISLAHDQNRINLFFAPTIPQPGLDQNIYEYKLDGLDKTWYQTLNKSVSYTNLSPGTYTLYIRTKGYPAASEGLYTSLRITVRQPWYFTWWAMLLWIAIFAAGAGIATRFVVLRRRFQTSLLKEQMENTKIRELNEAKFRFFTNVSHEFRTPLTLIIGQLDLLMESSTLPPSVYNRLTKVVRQTRHLNSLVTELIEFRKFEQNRREMHVAEYSLNSYINNEYDSFRELALLQDIDYTFTPCPEDVKVWIDAGQMRKVMYNLLSNAFKYTAKGGRINISVTADTAKGEAYIRIMDNGVGMEATDLEHIFERFYQAGNTMPQSNFVIGSGIGLALTKTIVEAHKGTIRAASQKGYGAIFTITLRLGADHLRNDSYIRFDSEKAPDNDRQVIFTPADNDTSVEISLPGDISGKEADKPTVLLVEDNTELLKILGDIFAPLYNVLTANNGSEAYDIVAASKPDLVVSDIMMPVMTGTDLCVKIKNNIELCHIPVVLLTALNMPEQTLHGLTRGADDYISKPFNARILLARCNNIVRARRLMYQQLSHTAEPDISLAATNNLDKQFLDTITSFIEENISDTDLSVAKIADRMCMGRTSFFNKFKALTGMSPNDFINSHRLKQAVFLLRQRRDLPISEIADKLGFSASSYFCRKFKDKFGVSPSQFRQSADVPAAEEPAEAKTEE